VNWSGGLGDGTTTHRYSPVTVVGLDTVVSVSALQHSLAVMADGTARAWGYNPYGQLGDGTEIDRHTPVPVKGLAQVSALDAGGYHSLAILSDSR